jgi:hypothetical protein
MANKHMSLESMLDEERRDVLALLEATSTARAKGSIGSAKQGRAASPFTNVPRSPVLDTHRFQERMAESLALHEPLSGVC